MTCIIGIAEKGRVYIGGDSAGVSGLSIRIRRDEKVFAKGDLVIGFTSSFRMGQIIRYCLKLPEHRKGKGDFDYLCTDFVDSLMSCLNEKGYSTNINGEISGGTFMLGYKGGLYTVQNDFQVSKETTSFASCGCGDQYALGALMATENSGEPPKKRIKAALSIVEFFSAGVSGPFNIVSTKKC